MIVKSGNILVKKRPVPPSKPSLSLRSQPVQPEFDDFGIAVLESHHGPRFFMDWRREDGPKWILAVGGSGFIHLGNRSEKVSAPAWVGMPAGTRHRIEDACDDSLSLWVICFDPRRFPDTTLLERSLGSVRVSRDVRLVERAIPWLRQMLFEGRRNSPESRSLRLSLALRLLVEVVRSENGEDGGGETSVERVRVYCQQLEHRFWQRETMDAVARRLGVSRRHFSSLVRRETGESWLAYRHRLRTDHALRLLKQGGFPIKSIAFECGYDDLPHFYRSFRRRFGAPPGRWQEMRTH